MKVAIVGASGAVGQEFCVCSMKGTSRWMS